jgi:hypothetical protein
MKASAIILLFFVSLSSCTDKAGKPGNVKNTGAAEAPDTLEMTNNFYDNTETFSLDVAALTVDGETSNPGAVDFSALPVHSVIVKEALPDRKGGNSFVGAYRYDGYSLFDILSSRAPKKVNSEEFKPIIDLYVEIVNAAGEKVVFSWGEIYYPVDLHKIIIAKGVSRIVPSKTKDLWPLPQKSKLVVAGDLLTSRNISEPVKITIRSIPRSYTVVQGMSPMFSQSVLLKDGDKSAGEFDMTTSGPTVTYETVFYGRGRGIHSTSPFTGMLLKDVLRDKFPVTEELLKTGLFSFAAKDGYRCAVSYSELSNRNDQHEFLLIKGAENEDGGLFRIFPAPDFFSDRAVKSLSEITLVR